MDKLYCPLLYMDNYSDNLSNYDTMCRKVLLKINFFL